MDIDAISVVISTSEMYPSQKAALRSFLLSFGRGMTSGCGLPNSPIGSKPRKDGMFGCCGNQCQHLPLPLRGTEILLIDSPVKILLHKSCKEAVVASLEEKYDAYLSPASENTGLCFDPLAAANKPNYRDVVDAVIDSSNVKSERNTHFIHVAQLGCKYKLPDASINDFFNDCNNMRISGLCVELIQFDVAFVFHLPGGRLFMADCKKPKLKDTTQSLLKGSSLRKFPLHTLPKLKDHKLDKTKIKGTIQVKKHDWQGKPTGRADASRIVVVDYEENSAAQILLGESNESMTSIHVHSPVVHNVKFYSMASHPLLQRRRKFPLNVSAMFGIHNKTIFHLQRLARNIEITLNYAYGIVERRGSGVRIEISLRPHEDDRLRFHGHFNDILFTVCAALCDFCKLYKPTVHQLPMRIPRTKALKLLSELYSMVAFDNSARFNDIYANITATKWLRAHLSELLITIGLSPEFGTKYIDQWLSDDIQGRFDPFNRAGSSDHSWQQENDRLLLLKRRMVSSLKVHLRHLQFTRNGILKLLSFVDEIPEKREPRKCFISLSLRDKHKLAQTLLSDIIPHMSSFLSHERTQTKLHLDTELESDVIEEDAPGSTFMDLSSLNTPLPKHPLASSIASLARMNSLWDPKRPGFNQILCGIVLCCINQPVLNHLEPNESTVTLLRQCYGGSRHIYRETLRSICHGLALSKPTGNRSMHEYQLTICRAYRIPCPALEFDPELNDRTRNEIFNEVMSKDIAVPMSRNRFTTTFLRITDNFRIDIPHLFTLLQTISSPPVFSTIACSNDLFEIIAESLNSQSTNCLRNCLRNCLQSLMARRTKLEHEFLTSTGMTNEDFLGCSSINELEDKHKFSLCGNGLVYPMPINVIFALVCFVYNRNILIYDMTNNKAIFFKFVNKKAVIYKIPSGINVVPSHGLNPLIFVIQRDGTYELKGNHGSELIRHTEPYLYSTMPLGGRVEMVNKACAIPNLRRRKRARLFYEALANILDELHPDYQIEKLSHLDTSGHRPDTLGLFQFLKELSCSHLMPGTGFDDSVVDCCPNLQKPLKSLLSEIVTGWDQLTHKFWGPIACLKHHNLVLGVLENIGRTKNTYFYAFNRDKQAVECRKVKGLGMLIDRKQTLYLYSYKTSSSHYGPEYVSEQKNVPRWCHHHSLTGDFSQIGPKTFTKYIARFVEYFNLTNLHVDEESLNPCDYRPELGDNMVVATSVTSKSNLLRYLRQKGVQHFALIMIFPVKRFNELWDACIVHHPLQHRSCAKEVLREVISRAPKEGKYTFHSIKGRTVH